MQGEAEGGEAAEGAAGAAASASGGVEGGPLGLLLSKELKEVRNRGREAAPESGTAPQVEQGILTKVAALCATAGSSPPSPQWGKRNRQVIHPCQLACLLCGKSEEIEYNEWQHQKAPYALTCESLSPGMSGSVVVTNPHGSSHLC